jgi:N-acetylmuramoyl-L-alanine amidase
MARIWIDPGHGGPDDGAQYRHHHEDDYNLAIAFFLDYELRLKGLETKLTREADAPVSLGTRVEAAKLFQADVFVSIHCDAWHRETAQGFSTHVYKIPHLLGAHIHESLQSSLQGHKDRGLQENNFYVLRETPMSAVLVECEFISNPETAAFLKEAENQRLIAQSIATGLFRYLAHKEGNHVA